MKNLKSIHTRVSDTLFGEIIKKVEEKGITISDYNRDILTKSVEPFDSLHSTDLLFVFAYIEYTRDSPKGVCKYEVKHLLNIINKHYQYLTNELQMEFDKVIQGLEAILKDMKIYGFLDEFLISFGDGVDDINFDFDVFYKCTNGHLPYR